MSHTSFTGIIIEESLIDTAVLDVMKTIKTEIEPVTPKHQTPWISQWTMHKVEVAPDQAEQIAQQLSRVLDAEHGSWYADYKNETEHFIIYPSKVFHITDRRDVSQYNRASVYGISIGIPDYQVDFSSHVIHE